MTGQQKSPKRKSRGRPVKNVIERIDAPPEAIARAMFSAADRKLEAQRQECNKKVNKGKPA